MSHAGHALPALVLARALAERGQEVLFHSDERWREVATAHCVEFAGRLRSRHYGAEGRHGGRHPKREWKEHRLPNRWIARLRRATRW